MSKELKIEFARKFCICERIEKEFNHKKSFLLKREECEDEFASIYSTTYEKVEKENFACSTKQLQKVIAKYSDLLKSLIDEGYIKVLAKGEFGRYTTRYEIAKPYDVDMKDPVIIKEIERIRYKEQLRFLKTNKPDNFRFLGLTSLSSEVLRGEKEEEYEYQCRLENYQSVINKMQKGELAGHVSVGGRVFSGFTSLPKSLRRFLVIIRNNGITGKMEFKKVLEIDINATIPRLLGCSVEDIIKSEYKNAKTKHEKGKRIREVSLFTLEDEEVVYTDFVKNVLKDSKAYDELIDDNDTYLNIIERLKLDMGRDEVKGMMLKLVFGTRKDDSKGSLKYLKFIGLFETAFPYLYDFIKANNQKYRNNKNNDLRSLNENTITSKIFKIESRVLNATMMDLDIDRLTLFDAVYVEAKNKDMILQKMKEKFEEVTGREYKGKTKEIERGEGEKEKEEREEEYNDIPTRLHLPLSVQNDRKAEQIVPKTLEINQITPHKLNDINSLSVQSNSLSVQNRSRQSNITTLADGRFTVSIKNKRYNSRKNESLEQFKARIIDAK